MKLYKGDALMEEVRPSSARGTDVEYNSAATLITPVSKRNCNCKVKAERKIARNIEEGANNLSNILLRSEVPPSHAGFDVNNERCSRFTVDINILPEGSDSPIE
jgi:hypothetical protein